MKGKWLRRLGFVLIVSPEPFTTPVGVAFFGAAYLFSKRQVIKNEKRARELMCCYLACAKRFNSSVHRGVVSKKVIVYKAYTQPIKRGLFYQPEKGIEYYPALKSTVVLTKDRSHVNKGLCYQPKQWLKCRSMPESKTNEAMQFEHANCYHPRLWTEYSQPTAVFTLKAARNLTPVNIKSLVRFKAEKRHKLKRLIFPR